MADMAIQTVPEPDAGTLAQGAAGDREAIATLYRAYARRVYTVAVRMLADREAAEEVLQEVFIELMRALQGYRRDAPFWAWLRRLTVSKVLMRLRSERARPALVAWTTEDGAAAWPDEAASMDIERALMARDLESALAALPPVARAVVWLHDVEGWTHQEIGAAMGNTTSFSKSQLSRAHQRLRALLGSTGREKADGTPDDRTVAGTA